MIGGYECSFRGSINLIGQVQDEVLSVSWQLIRSVRHATDLRLILPFGLDLRVGDVVSVAKGGTLTLEGIGPGTTGQRTLCNLLDDLNDQVTSKTE